ncbi:MAG: HupE/UreJ family protein [Verrucomicrobiota bacterium]
MHQKSFSQSLGLASSLVVTTLLAPLTSGAHDGSHEHVHLTQSVSMPTFGILSALMIVGLLVLLRPQRLSWLTFAAAAVLLSTPLVNAHHVMNTDQNPIVGGFSLPFHGLDHLLAMVAVGLFAATTTVKRWLFPAGFLAFMFIGMVMGFSRLSIPYVETGIWVSVIALGLILAVLGKMPNRIVAFLIAGFGIFHGYACGADLPNVWSPWAFGTGLVACTIAMIGVGFGIGLLLSKWDEKRGLRIAGALTAVVMIGMLVLPLFSNS